MGYVLKLVSLNGGLGNQLFQICFALHLKRAWSESVLVDKSLLMTLPRRRGERKLEVDPKLFGLRSTSVAKPIWRFPDGIRKKYVHYFASPSDWDVGIIDRSKVLVVGYFQDYRLVRLVQGDLNPVLMDLVGGVDSAEPYVAVHVRLGDYLSPRIWASHGVTDPIWSLERALEIGEQCGVSRRVICSDSPERLTDFVGPRLLGEFEIDESKSPWEVLGVLSQAQGLVMANSSLSWWGAHLMKARSTDDKPIIHPLPWKAEPSDLDFSLLSDRVTAIERQILQFES